MAVTAFHYENQLGQYLVMYRRLDSLRGFASKVRQFNISFTPGLSPVIGGRQKFAKPF